MTDWGGTLFGLGLYFVVPVFLGKVVVGGSWKAVLVAYAAWFSILLLFGLGIGGSWGEKLGWPLIFGMFLTIPAVPVLVVLLRIAGVR